MAMEENSIPVSKDVAALGKGCVHFTRASKEREREGRKRAPAIFSPTPKEAFAVKQRPVGLMFFVTPSPLNVSVGPFLSNVRESAFSNRTYFLLSSTDLLSTESDPILRTVHARGGHRGPKWHSGPGYF